MIGIKKVYIELTSACNLKCEMCFRNGWFGESTGFMSEFLLDTLIAELSASKTVETVVFGGVGEPTLHTGLEKAIKTLAENGKNTELITNATLLDTEKLKSLVNAGIGCIWVSVDGISFEDYASYRKGSDFERLLSTLNEYNRIRVGTKSQLGFTYIVTRENMETLNQINAFADKYGAEILNISHMIPAEPIKESETVYFEPINVGKMKRYSTEYVRKPFDYCEFIESGSVFVRWDGEVAPCMQLLHNAYTYLYENRRKVYRKAYGNIKDSSLTEIYNSKDYSDFRKKVSDFDFPCCTVCLGCELRDTNETDCMDNSFATCGACLWSQGIIFCP